MSLLHFRQRERKMFEDEQVAISLKEREKLSLHVQCIPACLLN